jgi:hypothetical protein
LGDWRRLRRARREERGECIGYDGARVRHHRVRHHQEKYTARMDGFWIILLEMAVALAIAGLIVWWTMKK